MKMKTSILILLLVLPFNILVDASKKIFCYYSSFAQTRAGIGKFLPEDIDPFLCTHIIYAFVDISPNGRDLLKFNWNDDGPNGLYDRTISLKSKNPQLKVLLAVGGWQIGSKPFIPMITNESNRKHWVKNVVRYLRKYSFDGFDMDWEFPATRGSSPQDKYRFTTLMKELYEAFRIEAEETGNEKLILTLATASGTYYISQSYEPEEIIKYLDFMLLMTYNYHGQWEKQTGHHAGLWKHRDDPPGEKSELHQEWSIDYWLDKGIPEHKLIVGIPTYGMSFTLADPNEHGVFAPANGGGRMGKYTSEGGILSYYEVCENINRHGWKTEWIDDQGVPYAYGGDQWVGYENLESIKLKAENIIRRDVAGAFVWSVEMDDFSGSCGRGKYPLLNTVVKILQPYGGRAQTAHATTTPRYIPSFAPAPIDKPTRDYVSNTREPKRSRRPLFTRGPNWRTKWHKRPKNNWDDEEGVNTLEKRTTARHWNARPTGRPSSGDVIQIHTTQRPSYIDQTIRPAWKKSPWKKPGTKSPSAAGSSDCSRLGVGMFTDPASCERFIMCLPGAWLEYGPIRMACPAGTRFDENLKICNHASSVECWV
ncbi:chitotriosidase-1 isoform X2 [Patella vulgata]|nr:chitotriosidase-1 isoform X2 [Patella vulgata]XP_050410631.1 chitotriosidase-1 isoform X2 [Patella vulgata]XP_050410714.1 chitotriosidase-1 isoform X2 [Patella vulgata]